MKLRTAFFVVCSILADIFPRTAEAQTSGDTPAHRAALLFMRGVNLGNYLEYAAGDSARTITGYDNTDFRNIRAEGFDHVRIPVAWHLYTGSAPGYTLTTAIFTQVDALVKNAQNNGLAVILDLHKFDAFSSNPTDNSAKFYALWRQVAAHYVNYGQTVAFELLNEPHDPITTTTLNTYYAEAIRQIREISPDRTIFVGPSQYNGIDDIGKLSLPATDRNLIIAVHMYDPYYFTHQGAEWALPDTATKGVIFPGPPSTPLKVDSQIQHTWVKDWFRDYNARPTETNPSSVFAFRSRLQRTRQWSDANNRPVQIGEFGCYSKFADATSRLNFHREIRKTMDGFGLGWAMWDWKAGFHYWLNGRPDPAGLRDAMFPPIELQVTGKGTIEFEAAKGKTFVVEKTASLVEPISWTAINTQTLTTPHFIFNDSNADAQSGGFYRVKWLK